MRYSVKQISSMIKVLQNTPVDAKSIPALSAMRGQRLTYQLVIESDDYEFLTLSAESPLPTTLFYEKSVFADHPITEPITDGAFVSLTPVMIPDVLIPLEAQNNTVFVGLGRTVIWVQVDIPCDAPAGQHTVAIHFTSESGAANSICCEMAVTVLPSALPPHRVQYTRWFHTDCIATAHGVPIYSQVHWSLIEQYIAAAVDAGINMLLVPIHTPPLDTQIGSARPCVQLVDIACRDGQYSFNTEKLRRFIGLCQKQGIEHYEMAHLFSQWGAAATPNIIVTENGTTSYKFGWHVASDSPEYASFLQQYIPAIKQVLRDLGVEDRTYFHISDEPHEKDLDTYRRCVELVQPLVGQNKLFDALSNREFWEQGIVRIPVTVDAVIHEFLECPVEEQWVYYCCFPQNTYPNSTLAMPHYRSRILGLLLYKYDIKGFLHWGFNFYNTAHSVYPINPYTTTSGDGAFPSGDGFIVYPAPNGVYGSMRGQMTRLAFQDVAVCRALEARIGRQAVISLIDSMAGRDLRFDDYPQSDDFCDNVQQEMLRRLL